MNIHHTMTIIAIIGSAGTGKDTFARLLSKETGFPVLCSYTTRPMREGELEGREHHFVHSCDMDKSHMLAYTVYGGYEYWTSVDQIRGTVLYVIDEDGVRDIARRFPDVRIIKILLTATRDMRSMRGVSQERMERDMARHAFPLSEYAFRISNNKSIAALTHKAHDVARALEDRY